MLIATDRGDEQMGNTWNHLDLTALGDACHGSGREIESTRRRQ
jgi:hypothetical protein